jgi:hypothetical protein
VPWIPGEYRGPRQAVLPDWKDEERVIDYVSQAISDLLCGPDPGKSKHEYGVNLSDKHRSGITWDMLSVRRSRRRKTMVGQSSKYTVPSETAYSTSAQFTLTTPHMK